MSFQLAVVQPVTEFGPGSREKNVANARAYVRRAAAAGADLVLLPETYPGEWREPIDWTPIEALCAIAKESGVYLVGGFAEPIDEHGSRCYNTLVLIGPDGTEIGRYRRTTPSHVPWIYKGGSYWDFDWVGATDLPVFETDLGVIGLLVCSEIYPPELARVLALKGAELLLLPTGLATPERHAGKVTGGNLYQTWKTLVFARAVENLAYTAVCANLPTPSSKGLTMVCSPEDVLVDEQLEGVYLSTVDLDRIRWLRAEQDRIVDGGPIYRAKPGALRDWRRQAVLDANPILMRGAPDPG